MKIYIFFFYYIFISQTDIAYHIYRELTKKWIDLNYIEYIYKYSKSTDGISWEDTLSYYISNKFT